MNYYLAIDIGASGGRHILGHMENGLLVTEEIYRFDNGAIKKDGELLWDTQHIFTEILNGLKACAAANKVPVSMGIDTWGVDYVLTDADGEKIGKSYCYRDARTACIDQEVYRQISEEDLYLRTGIQKQIFNTIYQLATLQKQSPSDLERAEHFLMIPDYFHFLLTGFHAAHVLAGMILLAVVGWIASPRAVETGAAFWHMVDLVWVLLFPVIYLL